MFGFLKRRRVNHPKITPELQKTEAIRHARKLGAAHEIAMTQLLVEDSPLRHILERAKVYADMKDLDLNLAALSFPRTTDADVHVLAYMWDWIDARTEEAMAAEIIEQVRVAVEAGELPRSADEFIDE